MAVNYGLGATDGGGVSFAALYLKTPEALTFTGAEAFKSITKLGILDLDTGGSTEFRTPNPVMTILLDQITVQNTGVYLITYNITTSGASNDDLQFRMTTNAGSPQGVQNMYSRTGDLYEVGSNFLTFLKEGDILRFQVANLDDTTSATVENMNVFLNRIYLSGNDSAD